MQHIENISTTANKDLLEKWHGCPIEQVPFSRRKEVLIGNNRASIARFYHLYGESCSPEMVESSPWTPTFEAILLKDPSLKDGTWVAQHCVFMYISAKRPKDNLFEKWYVHTVLDQSHHVVHTDAELSWTHQHWEEIDESSTPGSTLGGAIAGAAFGHPLAGAILGSLSRTHVHVYELKQEKVEITMPALFVINEHDRTPADVIAPYVTGYPCSPIYDRDTQLSNGGNFINLLSSYLNTAKKLDIPLYVSWII